MQKRTGVVIEAGKVKSIHDSYGKAIGNSGDYGAVFCVGYEG